MNKPSVRHLFQSVQQRASQDSALTEAILQGLDPRPEMCARQRSGWEYFVQAGIESLVIVFTIGLASLVFLALVSWLDLANVLGGFLQGPVLRTPGEELFPGLVAPTSFASGAAVLQLLGNGMWALACPIGMGWLFLRLLLIPAPDLTVAKEKPLCGTH